jgi:polysaccharide export outer membrane protein
MKVRADLLDKFEALLLPEQLAAYKEMAFRDIAERAINDAAILVKIGADDRQQAEIKKLFDDYMANYQQRALEAGAKTLKLLTPPQVEKLREQQEKLRKQLDGEEPPPTPEGGFSTGFVGSSQSEATTTRIGEKSDEKSDGESKKKDSPPEPDKSKTEKSGKVSLPAYIVEPPDILSVEMPKLKPLPPYHIGTSDVLQIRASSAIPGQPIDNLYLVEAEGVVNLGSAYGSVKVVGMSIEDATKAIQRKLADVLHNSDISVQLARTAGTQPVTGQYLVGPDGTINMRTYGVAKVAGMNAAEIKKVLEKHLAQFFDAPEVSVDIVGYNSKVYFVITGGTDQGDNVRKVHITGNETVLDALATASGPSQLSDKKIWVARPTSSESGGEQILPVDYAAITNGGSAATNYQLLPGDRVFIAEEKIAPPAPTAEAKTENKDYTFPISVSGRAMDLEGKPIAGAKIYLASLRVDWKRLAETTTDGQGRYEFRDVPLPIERATTNNRRDGGAFEIFGQASGYGFAWRPQKYFYPQPNGDTFIAGEDADMPVTFQVGEKIELDLKFPPPAKIRGRIIDDRGQPIPNAELAIRSCEPIRPDGYPTPEIFHIIWSNREFQSPNERETVPPEIKIRKTDADGRFEFTGLPPDCRFFIDVRPAGFAGRTVCAGTCEPSRKGIAGLPMFPGTMDLKFAKIREVTVQVLYGDTRKPAPKVFVCANNKEAGTGVASDNEGRALLRLPPGKYDLELLPAKGTPYLVREAKLEVPENPAKEPTVVELRPAAVVEVQVLDAVTGKGVADVDLWREITQLPSPDSYSTVQKYHEVHFFRSYEQETNICHVERPRTDSNGALRALFEPGKHRIGVAKEAFPEGYEAVEAEGQEIDAQAGKPIKITFHLKKK